MVKEERPDCPGHSGKCKFCKEEKGRFIYVGVYKQINRKTGELLIDYCCKQCANNDKYAKKKFPIDIAARFHAKVPRGDQI